MAIGWCSGVLHTVLVPHMCVVCPYGENKNSPPWVLALSSNEAVSLCAVTDSDTSEFRRDYDYKYGLR
eukprot:244103-Prymnesium_polylepis.1